VLSENSANFLMSNKEQTLQIVARRLTHIKDIYHALKESPQNRISQIKFGKVSNTNKAVVPHLFGESEIVVFDTSENWPRNGDRVVIFTQIEI